MDHYELLYLISANYTAEELQPIIDRVTHLIKTAGGEITKDDNLGKLKLAYPIKHNFHGYYILNEFNLRPLNLKKLEESLKLDSDILRHLVAKKKIKTAQELEEERLAQERQLRAREEELAKEEPKPTETPTPAKGKKLSLEELDKKLDEILKNEVL